MTAPTARGRKTLEKVRRKITKIPTNDPSASKITAVARTVAAATTALA